MSKYLHSTWSSYSPSNPVLPSDGIDRRKITQSSDSWLYTLTPLSVSDCIEEIYLLVQLFFWKQDIPGFDDSEINYANDILHKLRRIYLTLIPLSVSDLQKMLLTFSTFADENQPFQVAQGIRNILDQADSWWENKIDPTALEKALGVLFWSFWWDYQDSRSWEKRNIIEGYLSRIDKKFYIDLQREKVTEAQVVVPEIYLIHHNSHEWVSATTKARTSTILDSLPDIQEMGKIWAKYVSTFVRQIKAIPYIQSLLPQIEKWAKRKRLESGIKDKTDTMTKLSNYLSQPFSEQALFHARRKELDKLKWELDQMKKELFELNKEIEENSISVPSNSRIYREIALYVWVQHNFSMEFSLIAYDTFDSNVSTCKIFLCFLMEIKDVKHEYRELFADFCEFLYLFEKFKWKKPNNQMLTLEERKKFTKEYIDSLFLKIYWIFPQLNAPTPHHIPS
jgi:hypothetical protein